MLMGILNPRRCANRSWGVVEGGKLVVSQGGHHCELAARELHVVSRIARKPGGFRLKILSFSLCWGLFSHDIHCWFRRLT